MSALCARLKRRVSGAQGVRKKRDARERDREREDEDRRGTPRGMLYLSILCAAAVFLCCECMCVMEFFIFSVSVFHM